MDHDRLLFRISRLDPTALFLAANPETWDAIVPRLPAISAHGSTSLNPQPLPPSPPPNQLQMASVRYASKIVGIAIDMGIRGEDGIEVIKKLGEEWGPTPMEPPFPPGFLNPKGPPKPPPDPRDIDDARLAAGIMIASVASLLGESSLQRQMVETADLLSQPRPTG